MECDCRKALVVQTTKIHPCASSPCWICINLARESPIALHLCHQTPQYWARLEHTVHHPDGGNQSHHRDGASLPRKAPLGPIACFACLLLLSFGFAATTCGFRQHAICLLKLGTCAFDSTSKRRAPWHKFLELEHRA